MNPPKMDQLTSKRNKQTTFMKTLFLTILTLLFGLQLQAQISGLWLVTKVEVSGQTPTPTEKWFD